jgi:cytochrome c peroxidase
MVYDLPQFVYFDHSIHVSKGVGCASCHGRVDLMNGLWQEPTLHMEWCLDCHRQPEKHLRPRQFIFSMDYQQPADQLALGRKLKEEYDVEARVDCSACHR